MPKACYIHIPFCVSGNARNKNKQYSASKCYYCSFVSYNSIDLIPKYVKTLISEIKKYYKDEELKTLYFGGGTPSLLEPKHYFEIINCFNFENSPEITIELNPENGNFDYLSRIRELGINRLSIGAQSFNNELLKKIGRTHTAEQIYNTVTNAKKAGFENISLDLIYGLPSQTPELINYDLECLLKLNIQHISTYGLKIEKESYWGSNPPDNIPDDDLQADMYERICSVLNKNNYYRYEVSNFSIKGFESKHNLTYWNNEEYYGFGISAHGYIDGIRYSNHTNFDDYFNSNDYRENSHKLSEKEKLEEEIFLGLRKTAGINIQKINELYNIDFERKYADVLFEYSDYFIKTDSYLALNQKGIMLSNEILPEFLSD